VLANLAKIQLPLLEQLGHIAHGKPSASRNVTSIMLHNCCGFHLGLSLVAVANAKAISKTLEVKLTGNWYGDEREMLGQGIGIRLLD
jgi:hypothetical protein